jgi:hypothetical protein
MYRCLPCDVEVKISNKNKHENTGYHKNRFKNFSSVLLTTQSRKKERKEKNRLTLGSNVTTLIKSFTNNHWNELIECYGKQIFTEKIVHEGSSYPEYIIKNRLYTENGIFYDYLIRKYIYNIKNEDGYDYRAECMKKVRYQENWLSTSMELMEKTYM